MMLFFLRIEPLPEKQDGVVEIFRYVIDLTRRKPGCISCACYEAYDPERSILYLEQWESPEYLYRHIQSHLYQRIITAMELARKAPEMHFYEVVSSARIELIENLRTLLTVQVQ